jgi:hypothetical protein
MVVNGPQSLFEFLHKFDPYDNQHFKILEGLIEKYPNFQLIQAYYLKSVQQLKPQSFDKTLSQTAIATYDRELLYEFIEDKFNGSKTIHVNPKPKEVFFASEKKKNQSEDSGQNEKSKQKNKRNLSPKTLSFSEWANHLKMNQDDIKINPIDNKFDLIDSFLAKQRKIIPDKNLINNEDLSEQSWVNSNELMTETLAKVFIKQKKYVKALEAYQILGLKYPEKNSFFADRIEEIKDLQKLKN